MSCIVLTACTDAEIASYAAQNNIPMTPQLVNSIKQATEPSKPNTNKPNTNPNTPSNPSIPNTPNNPTNPMPTVDNGIVNTPTNPTTDIPQGTVIQGPKGDKGDQGPAGPQGEKGDSGDDGKDGKDGRGVQSMKINDEGHLIAYYTDGTSEDCGLVKGEKGDKGEDAPIPEIPDYEKVGFTIKPSSSIALEGSVDDDSYSYDYSISECSIVLTEIDNSYPAQKYHYKINLEITISNFVEKNPNSYPFIRIITDGYRYAPSIGITEFNKKVVFAEEFTRENPLTRITEIWFM